MDEWLLKEVNLTPKLSTAKVGFHVDKDIEVVMKLTSLEGVGNQS